MTCADSATSLYYFNARFYDPAIMRFMTRDPITDNSNAYAAGNPITNIDPTGMFVVANVDLGQLFFWAENQIRGWLGLSSCDLSCQESQTARFKLVSPLIGMVLPDDESEVAVSLRRAQRVYENAVSEAAKLGVDVKTLTAEQYANLDFYQQREANRALQRLSELKLLQETRGFSGELYPISTPMGEVKPESIVVKRIYEMKIGEFALSGSHNAEQLSRLLYLHEVEDYSVQYRFGPNPINGNLVRTSTVRLLQELFDEEPIVYGDEFWNP